MLYVGQQLHPGNPPSSFNFTCRILLSHTKEAATTKKNVPGVVERRHSLLPDFHPGTARLVARLLHMMVQTAVNTKCCCGHAKLRSQPILKSAAISASCSEKL